MLPTTLTWLGPLVWMMMIIDSAPQSLALWLLLLRRRLEQALLPTGRPRRPLPMDRHMLNSFTRLS